MFEIKSLKENLGDARKKKAKLVDERGQYLDKMERLAEKKSLTNSEQKTFDQLKNKVIALKAKIEDKVEEIENLTDKVMEIGEDPNFEDDSLPAGVGLGFGSARESKNVEIWESVSGKDKGKKVKVLNNRASLAKETGLQNTAGMSWGDYARARIAGYTRNNPIEGGGQLPQSFQNTMSTTSDSALVPEPLSAEIIDLARNKSRVFSAGAMTVPMDSKTLTIARITGDPSPAWKQESQPYTSSDITAEPLTFTAKTLVANVKASVELAEDAMGIDAVIRNSISSQLALEVDRVALLGSGVDPEPQGVYGATDVQTEDMGTDGAALTNYDPYSTAYQNVLEVNGEPNSVIHAPRTWGTLDRLKDSTNQPLTPPQSFQNLNKFQTNQIPIDMTKGTASNASIAALGDYSKLMVGIRTSMRLEVSRVASDSAGHAWENLEVWFRAYLRADIQLAHPDHFCIIDGIIPA